MQWLLTFFKRLRQGFRSEGSATHATVQPIPVIEWTCVCSRVWSDEAITAICGICEGSFKRSVAKAGK